MLIVEGCDIILDGCIGIAHFFQSYHGSGITVFDFPVHIRLHGVHKLCRSNNQNLTGFCDCGITASLVIQEEILIHLVELSTVLASLLNPEWSIEINTQSQ